MPTLIEKLLQTNGTQDITDDMLALYTELNEKVIIKKSARLLDDVTLDAKKNKSEPDNTIAAEDMFKAFQRHWQKTLPASFKDSELKQIQEALVTWKFNFNAVYLNVYVKEYQKACDNYLAALRQQIIEFAVKNLNRADCCDLGKKLIPNWQMYGMQGGEQDTNHLKHELSEALIRAEKAGIAHSDSALGLLTHKNKLVVAKYRIAQELQSALKVPGDASEKLDTFHQLLHYHRGTLLRDYDKSFVSFMKQLGIYAAIVLIGAVSFGVGGVLAHRWFFFNSAKEKSWMKAEGMGDRVSSLAHSKEAAYATATNSLWQSLESRHRWFKLFTDNENSEELSEKLNEILHVAEAKSKTKPWLEKFFKKDLVQENLVDDQRYNKFVQAVKTHDTLYVTDAVLKVLAELRAEQLKNLNTPTRKLS